jgi:hypothetical protein
LKAGDYLQIDWENLIEEIESLGRSEKRELENRLTTLFEHALKRHYVPLPDCYRGWDNTLKRTQKDLKKLLRDSPSLGHFLLKILPDCYDDAVDNLRGEYEIDFPPLSPFSEDIAVLLNQSFWEL